MNTEKSTEKVAFGDATSKDLISKIVDEFMGALSTEQVPEKKEGLDRIKVIKGKEVVFEKFDTGNDKDDVVFKEILSIDESPMMATGFLKIEKSSFDWYLGYDELDYVIEGTLEITYDGKTFSGRAGDVIYIPQNTAVTFSTPDYCKFFFAASPANWQDLCKEK